MKLNDNGPISVPKSFIEDIRDMCIKHGVLVNMCGIVIDQDGIASVNSVTITGPRMDLEANPNRPILNPLSEANPCPKCGRPPTADGRDPCLGNLPGVMNACCGHGIELPYVMTDDGRVVRGWEKIIPLLPEDMRPAFESRRVGEES